MTTVAKHRFVSPHTDGSDLTQVQPSAWNDAHLFTGGAEGDLLTRVLADPDGAQWIGLTTIVPWRTYTPVWAGAGGTPPTLGNGILLGRYIQIGTWYDVTIILRLGTTSVPGTSSYWTLSLPTAMKFQTGYAFQELAFICGVMSGAGAVTGGYTAYTLNPTDCYAIHSSGSLISPTTPFTWGTGALWTIRGSYEVA